jgi:cytochrome P450
LLCEDRGVLRNELPLIDESDPAFWADIHTPLRAARALAPIARGPRGGLLALGYRAVEAVLRDPRMASTHLLAKSGLRSGPLHDWWSRVMFSANPPEHTRLRSLVSRAFTPRRIAELHPVIESKARALIEARLASGRIDALHDYAHPLPIHVMGHLLAIPEQDAARFAEWTAKLGLTFSAIVDSTLRSELEASLLALDRYVEELIERRRATPGDDLLSALIAAEEHGERLSGRELVAMVENLLFAGHDTTRSFLSIAVPLLLQHPDQLARVREQPALWPAAVEECLRFEAPVFGSAREARERFEFEGVELDPGSVVSVALPSANRDPAAFPDPDRFDVTRFASDASPRPSPILSFGQGIHYCLGAALARAESEIALRSFFDLLPNPRLDESPRWVPFAQIRRYERVPVSFS